MSEHEPTGGYEWTSRHEAGGSGSKSDQHLTDSHVFSLAQECKRKNVALDHLRTMDPHLENCTSCVQAIKMVLRRL